MEASPATIKDAPWKSIVRSLARSSLQSPERILSAHLTTPTVTTASEDMQLRHAKVSILERTSDSTAIISWHDPTRCSYHFQLWRRACSARSGVCALSGIVINTGDSIYKPVTKPPPLNASAMILANEVESRLSYEPLKRC